jgi:MATE family multidrug resistance protein
MPIGIALAFDAMMFNLATLEMGVFGASSVAAHQIALNIDILAFMVALGIALAATVRVGLAAGRGDTAAARRAGFTAIAMAASCTTLCGLTMIIDGGPIASIYLDTRAVQNSDVIALTALFLKVGGAFLVFDGIQVVAALSLRGLKDTRMPMILVGIACWLIGAPATIVLGFGLHLQGVGVWMGLALGVGTAAIAMVARFHVLTRAGLARG